MNKVDIKCKTLEDFILEENDNIHKDLAACKHVECKIKEIITS